MTTAVIGETSHAPAPSLDALANEFKVEHCLARAALQRGAEHAKRAGEILLVAKAQLLHGEWLDLLALNCEVAERTAQLYMRVARGWNTLLGDDGSNPQRVADLPFRRVLALLEQIAHEEVGAFIENLALPQLLPSGGSGWTRFDSFFDEWCAH